MSMSKGTMSIYEIQVKKWREVQKFKAYLASAEEALKDINAAVMDQLVEDGLNKVTCEGRTLFIKTELWAGKNDETDWQTAAKRLKEVGLGDWLQEKFNSQSVSAIFRRKDKKITEDLIRLNDESDEEIEMSDEDRITAILTHTDDEDNEHDLSDILKVSRTFKLGSTVGSTK